VFSGNAGFGAVMTGGDPTHLIFSGNTLFGNGGGLSVLGGLLVENNLIMGT